MMQTPFINIKLVFLVSVWLQASKYVKNEVAISLLTNIKEFLSDLWQSEWCAEM